LFVLPDIIAQIKIDENAGKGNLKVAITRICTVPNNNRLTDFAKHSSKEFDLSNP